ncbi:MAG TPA: hypothetical protein VFW78_10520 [Bacteroidia bacterium]|nr:hypothetical protein [Bacteroidia bacterium]
MNNRTISFVRLLTLLLMLTPALSSGQAVFQHVSHTSIYEFLDEMANLKIIELNSAIKPYTRKFISQQLVIIETAKEELNQRQQQELSFFMKEYSKELDKSRQTDYVFHNWFGKNRVKFSERQKRPDLFYWSDSVFNFTVNPILGAEFWSNDSGTVYHRWNGAEMFFTAYNHIGVYANLRDNYESKNISGPSYLTQITGGGFKAPTYGFSDRDAVEYSEMRGGITYGWKWGYVGVIKEHNVWGNNYHGSNIFSDRNPSFAQLKLQMKPVSWLELNYFHGWLSSKVIDSSRTPNTPQGGADQVFVPKYLAANMITVRPVHNFFISIGNSIVYAYDLNAAYFIPVMFFKSLDHTYSSLGNSQLFFDISSRNIKKCHIYSTLFMDELSFGRIFNKNYTHRWSGKFGVKVSDVIPNVSVTAEYTRSDVLTYQHYNPVTTFTSTEYNLGNYLRDNSQEIFLDLTWKPLPKLSAAVQFNYATKGPEYPDDRDAIDPNTGEEAILSLPFQETIVWKNTSIAFETKYELVNDLIVKLRLDYSDVRDDTGVFSPGRFTGKQLMVNTMITFGF